jgi:hypothetical protein
MHRWGGSHWGGIALSDKSAILSNLRVKRLDVAQQVVLLSG